MFLGFPHETRQIGNAVVCRFEFDGYFDLAFVHDLEVQNVRNIWTTTRGLEDFGRISGYVFGLECDPDF